LAAQLVLDPPHRVVWPVEIGDRLTGSRQGVERPALLRFADLPVDPALPGKAGWLALCHRASLCATSDATATVSSDADRELERQLDQAAAASVPAVARRAPARRGVPAGNQARRRGVR